MRQRALHILAILGWCALVLPALGAGASSISAAIDPAVAGAHISVAVTMASDDPAVKRAYVVTRADDGRACEATLAMFNATTPVAQLRGIGASIAFVAGTTSVQAPATVGPGVVRVCGYLQGSNQANLAGSDTVVTLRLPTAALAATVSPERPVFDQLIDVRVTGTSQVAAVVDVFPGAGSCTRDPNGSVAAQTQFVQQGPVDLTFPNVEHREGTDRICVVATPDPSLPAPDQGLILASVDRPFSQDLGGAIRLVSARLHWRRLEIVGEVTGARSVGDVTAVIEGARRCRQGAILSGQYGWGASLRGSRVILSRMLDMCAGGSPSLSVGLQVTTARGAQLRSDLIPIDVSDTLRRRWLLVPDVSIGGVRLGMTKEALRLQQGAALVKPPGVGGAAFLLSEVGFFGEAYEFDHVAVGVRGGRVVAIVAAAGDPAIPFQTASGLLLKTSALAPILRALPTARCLRGGHARFTPLCHLGRFTIVKTPTTQLPGYFAIGRRLRVR